MLSSCYNPEFNYEIGVDEAGRGPMFGRLYVAGAVLPKDDSFHHDWMKDSKKFSSEKKIKTVSDYIKENAISYSIQYIEHDIIDKINIRQSVHRGMHESIREIFTKSNVKRDNTFLLIDGNDFKPYTFYDEDREEICALPHETIEGGDNKYTAIAAASILAKVARDEYIYTLCEEYPQLVERYGLGKNKGYGTKQHLDGIREFGITQWHRKTYGLCKNAKMNTV
jgi:ribonuclease HII